MAHKRKVRKSSKTQSHTSVKKRKKAKPNSRIVPPGIRKKQQKAQKGINNAFIGMAHAVFRPEYIATLKKIKPTLPEEFAEFADFISAEDIEWLHRNGTVAVQPSILRHLPDTDKLLDVLTAADRKGNFDAVAHHTAAMYDVNVREVYTLWYSP